MYVAWISQLPETPDERPHEPLRVVPTVRRDDPEPELTMPMVPNPEGLDLLMPVPEPRYEVVRTTG